MDSSSVLGDKRTWQAIFEGRQVGSYAAAGAAGVAGSPTILAAAGTTPCAVVAEANRLQIRYTWAPFPDQSLLYSDTRDLPRLDLRIPQQSFVPVSFDPGLYTAWQQHPETFEEEYGAVHGNGWRPDIDASGSRLISAAANAAGYQGRPALEAEFRQRKAHLLANDAEDFAASRTIVLLVPQLPGGTSTGLSPHLRHAGARACAAGSPLRLHTITALALPTETAEDGVRINALEAVIEAVADQMGCHGGGRGNQVICVSPAGPRLIIEPERLGERVARIVWTLASPETGILPAYLADAVNLEAASTTDLRGLHRSLSFAGVGVVDPLLFEYAQRFTLELLLPVAEFIYGAGSKDGLAQVEAASTFSTPSGAPFLLPAPTTERTSLPRSRQMLPDTGGAAAVTRRASKRRGLITRAGDQARAEMRELQKQPLIGVDWRRYAATGMTSAEERTLRAEYGRRVDEEYRRDVFAIASVRRQKIFAGYKNRVTAAVGTGGLPAATAEGQRCLRTIADELQTVGQPAVGVTAEELEKHEKPQYRGRSLRQRMKRVQKHLDGRMRVIRREALVWIYSEVTVELKPLVSGYEERIRAAAPIVDKIRWALGTMPTPSATSIDMHVVPAIQDAEVLDRLRDEISTDLAAFTPAELLLHLRDGDASVYLGDGARAG